MGKSCFFEGDAGYSRGIHHRKRSGKDRAGLIDPGLAWRDGLIPDIDIIGGNGSDRKSRGNGRILHGFVGHDVSVGQGCGLGGRGGPCDVRVPLAEGNGGCSFQRLGRHDHEARRHAGYDWRGLHPDSWVNGDSSSARGGG